MWRNPNAATTIMISTLTTYLSYEFVQNALIAGTLSAILGAIVGYFVIIRNAGFAAHGCAAVCEKRRGGVSADVAQVLCG